MSREEEALIDDQRSGAGPLADARKGAWKKKR